MPTRLTYHQARLLLLALGIVVASSNAAIAWDRGAAPTEVLAPLLYIPVFVGAVFWAVPGGLIAAAGSSLVYTVLLADQTAVIGLGSFAILLVFRITLFFFFGVITALGMRYVEGRLKKLELYDQIDDLTELYNSAFFVQDVDLEVNRADRYRTFFSVVSLAVDRAAFDPIPARRYRRVLKDLAKRVEDSIRQVDRAARADSGDRDLFLLILPQTARQGGEIFAERLLDASSAFLAERGVNTDGTLGVEIVTYPDEPEAVARLRDEVAQVEAGRRAVRGNP